MLCSLELQMPKLNRALFDPLTRTENACQRVSGIMLNASNLPPKDIELVRREIRDAMEAFKATAEACCLQYIRLTV